MSLNHVTVTVFRRLTMACSHVNFPTSRWPSAAVKLSKTQTLSGDPLHRQIHKTFYSETSIEVNSLGKCVLFSEVPRAAFKF